MMNPRKALFPVCIAALGLFLAGHASAALLAHWSFDSDFTDGAGSNDLTANGTPTITTTAGEYKFGGGALDLDYNADFLSTTSTINFSDSQAWSVAFWGKKDSGVDNRSGMVIGTSANDNFIWTPDNPGVVEGLRFRNSSGATYDYDGYASGTTYHHWAVVADGSGNIEVYRDGASLGTISATTTFSIDSIGSGLGTVTNNYGGQLDEIYVFDEAIDAATVSSLYNTNTIPEPSVILLGSLGALVLLRRRRD